MAKRKAKLNKRNNKNKKPIYFPKKVKRWMFGILLILLAVIIGLSFFGKSGKAGEFFLKWSCFLIGDITFVLPLFLILAALIILKSKIIHFQKVSPKLIILAIFILIFGISGFLGTFNEQTKPGGLFGYSISYPFLKFFGEIATQIIFGAVAIIGFLIFWYFLSPYFQAEQKILPSQVKEKIKEEKPLIKRIFKKISQPKFKVKKVPLTIKESLVSEQEKKLQFKTKPIEVSKVSGYKFPTLNLLEPDYGIPNSGDIKENSVIIKRTLGNFGIEVEVLEINIGPTVTQYALKPAENVKLSRITALSNNLALGLAAHPIRIEAPIPGRSLVGIEVPNKIRSQVRLKSLLSHSHFQGSKSSLLFALGRDVAGNPIFADLSRMPHLLVAGSTGTGKTVCLNDIILSLLYKNEPQMLRFILIDPKRVEFSVYNELLHLLGPVVYDAQKTIDVLAWLTSEMERRFDILSEYKVKDIASYNKIMIQAQNQKENLKPLPYIVLIIDELADLMAAKGREVESGIVRLAQMARAVGIHLIVATQRPSVEVITGLIKANITSRIAFQTASQIDSRTILDMAGAEKLLGLGDLLFISSEISKPKRVQGALVSEKEIKKVVNYIKTQGPKLKEDIISKDLSESLLKSETFKKDFSGFYDQDPLYQEAKQVVLEANKASASLLQRKLRIGYARAARLIDMLEESGVVGPADGAKPRQVYSQEQENG